MSSGLPVGWTIDRESDMLWRYHSPAEEETVTVEYDSESELFAVSSGETEDASIEGRLDAFLEAYDRIWDLEEQ
jgi:hypothetical protein